MTYKADSKKELSQPAEIVDESNITLLPVKAKKIDLHDSHAIRRELASVYRDMRSGKVEMADGTKLSYVLGQILKAYETCELQKQLDSINRELNRR